jgi:hypothetical protein
MDNSWFENEEIKEKFRETPVRSIEMLYISGWKLNNIVTMIENGMIIPWSMSLNLKDVWNQVNFARLWTENENIRQDGELQTALGLINDSKCMIDSMQEWDSFTSTGVRNVVSSIKLALNTIREIVIELEYELSKSVEE